MTAENDRRPSAPPQRGSEQGLSLVENLLSLLLLSFIVLGSLSLLTISSRENRLAKNRSIATSLAAERLDHLTSVAFRGSTDVAGYALAGETFAAGPPPRLTLGYGSIAAYPEYRRVVTLQYNTPQTGMLKAKVSVFWQDPQQGEKSHELLTVLHPGLEQP